MINREGGRENKNGEIIRFGTQAKAWDITEATHNSNNNTHTHTGGTRRCVLPNEREVKTKTVR